MRYWTVLGYRQNRRNGYYAVPFYLEEVPETRDVNYEAGAAVLVDPTPEDLRALGNAFLINQNDWVVVAFAPSMLEDPGALHAQRVKEDSAYGYCKARFRQFTDRTQFVRNGEFATICEGCGDLFKRVAGGCLPGMYQCAHTMFPAKARMTMPPDHLYLEPKQCCDRADFTSYSVDTISEDVTPDTPIVIQRDPRDVLNAGTTRLLKSVSCPKCMFHGAHGCAGSQHPRRCEGPFFAQDVPEPERQHRQAIRLMGTRINTEQYKGAAKDRSNWDVRRWRTDPDIKIGIGRSGYASSLRLIKTSCTSPSHDAWLTPNDEWDAVRKTLKIKLPQVRTRPTLLEKLVCLGYQQQDFGNYGSGWHGYCELCRIEYYQQHDRVNFEYFRYRHETGNRIERVDSLVSSYPSLIRSIPTGHRGSQIREILELRTKDGQSIKTVKRDCRIVLDTIAETARLGEEVPSPLEVHAALR